MIRLHARGTEKFPPPGVLPRPCHPYLRHSGRDHFPRTAEEKKLMDHGPQMHGILVIVVVAAALGWGLVSLVRKARRRSDRNLERDRDSEK